MAKRVVLGTAGHVDHGKTSLVKALTGVDTDQLPEEKRRGITIELGFAHLTLADGSVAGVVDVPGHERFVRAMAAGAFGLDLVLLVVAVDEGAMPQTREHLDICRLLGVRKGVVALTKIDLAGSLGPELVDLARADLKEELRGTFLESAAVVPVSTRDGTGIAELRRAIDTVALQADERPAEGPAFLPIDRAFSVKGFGTVVTGTLFAGSLRPEDLVDLVPDGPHGLRVRGIQAYGKPEPVLLPGMRGAVNLVGIETSAVGRGMALVATDSVSSSNMLDVELEVLPSAPKPLRTRSKVVLHLGTGVAEATVTLLDRRELAPGESAPVQLTLGSAVAAFPGQRFIVRGFAASAGRGSTLGGGRVLDAHPVRHRHKKAEAAEALAVLRQGKPEERLLTLFREAGFRGARLADLGLRLGIPAKVAERALGVLAARGEVVLYDKGERAGIGGGHLEGLVAKALRLVSEHSDTNPLSKGLSRESLRTQLADGMSPKVLAKVLDTLVERGEVELIGEVVGRPGARLRGNPTAPDALVEQVRSALERAGLGPARVAELAASLGVDPKRVHEVLKHLRSEGRAVRVLDDMYFDAAAIGVLKAKLVEHLHHHREIDIQQFKEMVGQTRKWTVPLGEYFDHERVTMRVGEKRVLRGAGE